MCNGRSVEGKNTVDGRGNIGVHSGESSGCKSDSITVNGFLIEIPRILPLIWNPYLIRNALQRVASLLALMRRM
jgi:hypothetical protein